MCHACVGTLLNTIGSRHLSRLSNDVVKTQIYSSFINPSDTHKTVADIIIQTERYHNGFIIPVNADTDKKHDALAIADGRILGIGTINEINVFRGKETRTIQLKGQQTVLPGFIDPHQHTLTGSIIADFFTDCGYDQYQNKSDVQKLIVKTARSAKKGEWILLSLYDNLLQGGDLSMHELNLWAPDNPVLVYYINMHTATGNQLAFDVAKINQDPSYYKNHPLPNGGHFGTTASGTYNGMIYEEGALDLFIELALKEKHISPEKIEKAIKKWLANNAKAGNTTVHEAGVLVPENVRLPDFLAQYASTVKEGQCRASISLMYSDTLMTSGELTDALRHYGPGSDAMQTSKPTMTLYGMKIVGDGSNQARTAAQTQHYLDEPENFGKTNYDQETLSKMVRNVAELGWPVLIHCNGDKTLGDALAAIDSGYTSHPVTGINRIEHCTMTRPEQLSMMKKLSVQPSFLMNHVYYYGNAYKNRLFGRERAERMDPAQDCVKMNIPFSLHTDAPCSSIGPLQLIHTAVNRICYTGVSPDVTGPAQCINLTEAIKAVTINAAAHIGRSEQLGSLEPGKFADLVILDKNPYHVEPHTIKEIKVIETWVGGSKVTPGIE